MTCQRAVFEDFFCREFEPFISYINSFLAQINIISAEESRHDQTKHCDDHAHFKESKAIARTFFRMLINLT